ncbi:MAG: hypothetical protein JNM84_03805 [Planctomycetes bacterium]|nr:hypothetical protein [Planctomycetota bacterium]
MAIAARAERREHDPQCTTAAKRWQAVGESRGDVQRLAALLPRALTVRHAGLGVLRLPSCALPLAAMLMEVELELSILAAQKEPRGFHSKSES